MHDETSFFRIIGHPAIAGMWAELASGHDQMDWETFKHGLTERLSGGVSAELKRWFANDESRWNKFKVRLRYL